MTLTVTQTLVTIAAIALGVQISRWLPFAAFSGKKELPEFIKYLGRVLPPALMGLLVVYCLKGVSLTAAPFGAPEILAIVAIILLHNWKRNSLLSIGAGTVFYMILVQVVFA